LQTLERKSEIIEFWKSAFSQTGIPSMLIDESIPFMNQRVTFYLDHLTNNRYIVSFDTLSATKSGEIRDKISVNVLDTYTKANSRIQLSGGQTRLIDISIILTLGDLQSKMQDISFNILLFDEIFDSLDEENIGFVSKVLTMIKEGFKDPDTDLESPPRSIYLISHKHEDQLEADETLNMT
jgi:exonuclease SbcC